MVTVVLRSTFTSAVIDVPIPCTVVGNLYGYNGCHDLAGKNIVYLSLLLSAVSFCMLQKFSIMCYSEMGKINGKNIFYLK